MSEVPSEDEVQDERGTITWYRNYPDDLWNRLPPEVAMQHTDKMEDARRTIQAYEKHHGLPPTI